VTKLVDSHLLGCALHPAFSKTLRVLSSVSEYENYEQLQPILDATPPYFTCPVRLCGLSTILLIGGLGVADRVRLCGLGVEGRVRLCGLGVEDRVRLCGLGVEDRQHGLR
jgi:hypothetical protein